MFSPQTRSSRVSQDASGPSPAARASKRVTLILLLIAAGLLGAGYFAAGSETDTAPGEPNPLHPNSTSPDEQGESGSLIEHPSSE